MRRTAGGRLPTALGANKTVDILSPAQEERFEVEEAKFFPFTYGDSYDGDPATETKAAS